MDDPHSIGERQFSKLSVTGRVVIAIILLAILLQLMVLTITILRGLIYFLIVTINVFVIWPIWTLISVLRLVLKLLKFVVMVLVWAIYSLVRGVAATFVLVGICGSRHTRAKTGGDGGGGEVLETGRQEASLTSFQGSGVAVHRPQGWQIHFLLSDGPDRCGHNIGFIVGGIDGARVWQATPPGGDRLVAQGSLARRSTTAYAEATRTRSDHGS